MIIHDYILQNNNPIKICYNYNISKQKLQYYLNKLKKKELIYKIYYGTWQITEKGKDLENWRFKRKSFTSRIKPPPPSFHVEQTSEKNDVSKELLSTIAEDINNAKKGNFIESPNETSSNSMTTMRPVITKAWRPNNFRRELTIKETSENEKRYLSITIKNAKYTEHTKILSIKKYKPNVTVQIAKNHIIGIWSQRKINGIKETYKIETYSDKDTDEWVDKKKTEIEEKLDSAMKEIAKKMSCLIPSKKPIWTRSEHGLKGHEILKGIPEDLIIHDTYFKKVYANEPEIKTGKGEDPVATLKTFMKNSILFDHHPIIAKEIALNRDMIKGLIEINRTTLNNILSQSDNIKYLAENINLHIPVLKKLGTETHNIGTQSKRIGNAIDRLNTQITHLNFPQIDPLDSIISQIHNINGLLKPNIRHKIEHLSKEQKTRLDEWIFQNFTGQH